MEDGMNGRPAWEPEHPSSSRIHSGIEFCCRSHLLCVLSIIEAQKPEQEIELQIEMHPKVTERWKHAELRQHCSPWQ